MASFHEAQFIKTALEVTEVEEEIKLLVSQKDKIDVELHQKGVTELVRQHDEVCRALESKRLLQKSLQEKNSRMLMIISKSRCPADYQTPNKKVKLGSESTLKPAVTQSKPSSSSSSKSSVRTPSSSLIKKCKVKVKENVSFMSDDELIAASQQLFESQQLFSPSPKCTSSPKCTLDESIKLLEDGGESGEMKENDEKVEKEDREDGEGEETKKDAIEEVNGEGKHEDGEDSEGEGSKLA